MTTKWVFKLHRAMSFSLVFFLLTGVSLAADQPSSSSAGGNQSAGVTDEGGNLKLVAPMGDKKNPQQGAPGQMAPYGAGPAPGQSMQGSVPPQSMQGPMPGQGAQGPMPPQGMEGPMPGQGTQGAMPPEGMQGPMPGQGTQGAMPPQGMQGPMPGQGVQGAMPPQGMQGPMPGQGAQGTMPSSGAAR